VASVEFVCSTCHAFQAQLFDTSPHKKPFEAMGMPACVTCHSNHRIARPSDAMLGTGKDSVCLNCHSSGDSGFQVAEKMHTLITGLEAEIERAEGVLNRAERSGMEVSEAKLQQTQARDALTRARVAIHNFTVARLQQDIEEGRQVAEKTHAAGIRALEERDYRRAGLALSLVTILVVLVALCLYIRALEGRPS
jgi:predicted CXXCH cytochrome family protein